MNLLNTYRIIRYHKQELGRLEENLRKIANGDFNIDTQVSEGDNSILAEKEQYIRLNRYLEKTNETVSSLRRDADKMAAALQSWAMTSIGSSR